jgi:hypothetical protein
MCNRLFAIISAMRYGRQTCQEITIYWYTPVSRYGLNYDSGSGGDAGGGSSRGGRNDEHLHLFFKNIPNIKLKTWVPELVNILSQSSDIKLLYDGSALIPIFMKKNFNGRPIYPKNMADLINQPLKFPRYKNVIINMPTHPFGFDTDNNILLNKHTYPIQPGIREKDQYELELSKFSRKLEPKDDIFLIIQHFRKLLDSALDASEKKYKIGLHIRRTDLASSMSLSTLDKMIQTYYNKFSKTHIFWICSDDPSLQEKYTTLYTDMISYNDPDKYKNNLLGVKESLVDLYLLAYCDHIVGTKGSSFSYYSWILSKDDTLFEIGF